MQIKKVNFALFAGVFLAATVQAQQAVPVQVQALSTVLVEVESSAQAEVRSLNSSTLSSEVTAVVSEVLVDVGHEVHHGQRLLELDTSDYQLALAQAEANLEAGKAQKMQADARLKRARELSEKQYASADDLLARETELMTAAAQIQVQESNVALARHNLEKCHIVAPFDGAVDQRWAQVGAYVTHGSPLLSLVQTDRFELDARIPDELAQSLQQATSTRFVSRGESWPVKLLRLSPVVNPEQRSRHARFEFTAEAPAVGRSGEIVWRAEKGMLPVNLVVRREGKLGMFLNRSGTAAFEELPNAQEGRPVSVDLPADTEIIVQGAERLQHGDRIEIMPAATP
ncbi:MAG TPA: efflux RND transporter periplasmic adaptor subunit [Xanthomonadales bacterium]|nr:efflux RND transporter periplasmic adaptor subunit [Xanthomonadales bacterium]